MKKYSRYLFPVIYIILGALTIIFKGEVLRWAAICVGAVALLIGVLCLIKDIKDKQSGIPLYLDLMFIIVGITTILFGSLFVRIIGIVLGIICILAGMIKIAFALSNTDVKSIFIYGLITGILYLSIGIMLFIDSKLLYIIAGSLLILNGVLLLIKPKNKTDNIVNDINNRVSCDYIDVETKDLD